MLTSVKAWKQDDGMVTIENSFCSVVQRQRAAAMARQQGDYAALSAALVNASA